MLIGPEGRSEEYLCQFPITERKKKWSTLCQPQRRIYFIAVTHNLLKKKMSQLQELTFVATEQE
jgi:hypothetical protein